MNITDGQGRGYQAGVSSQNRLRTDSITFPQEAYAATKGDTYAIDTGKLVLTSANESVLLYIYNQDVGDDLLLHDVKINAGFGVGSTLNDLFQVKVYNAANATGTIISGGTSITAQNLNFGSSKNAILLIHQGGEGFTIANSVAVLQPILTQLDEHVISVGSITLPLGASIAISVTPPPGNTLFPVRLRISAHRHVEI